MIEISELITDPDFCQKLTILRSHGKWVAGNWQGETREMQVPGVATVAKESDLEQVPEADRQTGMMCFYVAAPETLHLTQSEGLSDLVLWRGRRYKILQLFRENDWGYCKGVGVQTEAV